MDNVVSEIFAKNENFEKSTEIRWAHERYFLFPFPKKIARLINTGFSPRLAWKLQVLPPPQTFLYSIVLKKIKKMGLGSPIDILEIGCGLGEGATRIARYKNCKMLATDTDKECISFNKTNFAIPNIEWRHIGWEEITNNYDVIIAIDVIEHLREYELFLKKVCQHLKPRGVAFLSTPNKPLYKTQISSKKHFREWDSSAFASLMKRYFLEVDVLIKNGKILATLRQPI